MTTKYDFFKAKDAWGTIGVEKIIADIAGGLVDGIILDYILWWASDDEFGNPRMKLVRDGELWVFISNSAWWQKFRITEKQAKSATRRLEESGLIFRKRARIGDGTISPIYRMNWPVFLQKYEVAVANIQATDELGTYKKRMAKGNEADQSAKGQNQFGQKGRILPETTPIGNMPNQFGQKGRIETDKKAEPIIEQYSRAISNSNSNSIGGADFHEKFLEIQGAFIEHFEAQELDPNGDPLPLTWESPLVKIILSAYKKNMSFVRWEKERVFQIIRDAEEDEEYRRFICYAIAGHMQWQEDAGNEIDAGYLIGPSKNKHGHLKVDSLDSSTYTQWMQYLKGLATLDTDGFTVWKPRHLFVDTTPKTAPKTTGNAMDDLMAAMETDEVKKRIQEAINNGRARQEFEFNRDYGEGYNA